MAILASILYVLIYAILSGVLGWFAVIAMAIGVAGIAHGAWGMMGGIAAGIATGLIWAAVLLYQRYIMGVGLGVFVGIVVAAASSIGIGYLLSPMRLVAGAEAWADSVVLWSVVPAILIGVAVGQHEVIRRRKGAFAEMVETTRLQSKGDDERALDSAWSLAGRIAGVRPLWRWIGVAAGSSIAFALAIITPLGVASAISIEGMAIIGEVPWIIREVSVLASVGLSVGVPISAFTAYLSAAPQ